MALTHALKEIDEAVLRAAWQRFDIPTERIASTVGVTRQGLSCWAKSRGLSSRYGNQAPNKKGSDQVFREMWLAGVSTRGIAQHFGFSSAGAVTKRRQMLGLPGRCRTTGPGARGGYQPTISLAEFLERKTIERMAALAALENAAARRSGR